MSREESSQQTGQGDPMCMYPRLECTDCGEYAYVTSPRHTRREHIYLECDCKAVRVDQSIPEVWVDAF